MFSQFISKFGRSVTRDATAIVVVTILAQPVWGQSLAWWHNVPGTIPIDTKRSFESISNQIGAGLTAILTSDTGFATGFTVSLSPYKILATNSNTSPTHMKFRVNIDMNNDGVWEQAVMLPGPSDTGFSESVAVTATWNYPEPVYPAVDKTNVIRWQIDERRASTNGNFLNEVVRAAGTVSITTLATPTDVYVDPLFPTPESSTLSGYRSLDGIVDRPLVVVEGFDMSNTTYPSEFFGQFLDRPNGSGSSMIDALVNVGYDVYVYNYGDARLSMRDNAQNLLGVLLTLKEDIVPGGSPIRILGISMGGVVTRYALAWAEANGFDHGCDMFISGDAPQQGAWLNINFQQWLEDNENQSSTVAKFAGALKTTAAMELLRCNMFDLAGQVAPGNSGEIEGTPTYLEFFTELNELNGDGYPHRTRNIGVSFAHGELAQTHLFRSQPNSVVNGKEIAELTARLNGNTGIINTDIEFTLTDIRPGSYQPAFRPATIVNTQTLWNGRIWLFGVHDPVFLLFQLLLGQDGAPSFIWASSALDLWGVTVSPGQTSAPDIIGWDHTKFDEIYVNSDVTYFHDKLSPALAGIIIGNLLEGPQFVYPNLITPIVADYYEQGNPMHISWDYAGLQDFMSVKLFIRPVGGAWQEIYSGPSVGPSDFLDWNVSVPDGQYELKLETTHPDAGLEVTSHNGPFTIATQSLVAPVASQLHPSGNDLNVQWGLHSDASSVDVAYSPDGGQTFPINFLGLSNTPCPNDPLSGCYTLSGLPGATNQARIRITSHYPYGASGSQSSGDFTIWGIDATSIQPTVTTSCPSGISITVAWTTNVVTDGLDKLELYPPSTILCNGAPTHVVTAPSNGSTHQVSFSGICQTGVWAYVVKSTKAGSETESACQIFTVNGCASCSTCNPPCELN